jgi:hypothetical protein
MDARPAGPKSVKPVAALRRLRHGRAERTERGLPAQLLLGIALIATAWPVAWSGPRPYSEYTFFPLWLGYILTVDGLVALRSGSSLWQRGPRRFVGLFVVSAPAWWVFEFTNHFLDNWHYLSDRQYGFLAYHALASLDFSTVVPAIFETAALYGTTGLGRRGQSWLRLRPGRNGLVLISAAGLAIFVASLAFPSVMFPAVWLGLFFFFDPINRLRGRPSLAGQVAEGRWDTVLVLFAAGLTCGFFWEMWNYWSMPKWVYDVPGVDRLKLFEMPLLGYGGYLPFALELYALYQLALAIVRVPAGDYLRFDRTEAKPAESRAR